MQILYKVINTSNRPIIKQWNFNLMSDKMLKEYEAFKQTKSYIGDPKDPEDIAARKKLPEIKKMREFLAQQQAGVPWHDVEKDGKATVRVPVYKWALGPSKKAVMNSYMSDLVKICKDYNILVSNKTTKEDVYTKLNNIFGKNVQIMNARQLGDEESGMQGLRTLEIKEIRQRRSGKEDKVIKTGVLKIEEVKSEEYLDNRSEAEQVADLAGADSMDDLIKKVEDMDYRELQEMAQTLGIKAGGIKANQLRKDVKEALKEE